MDGLGESDSWFNAPGLLDTATGRITRIASDNVSDYKSMNWVPDGRILAMHIGLRFGNFSRGNSALPSFLGVAWGDKERMATRR